MTNQARVLLNHFARFLFSLYAPLNGYGTENVPVEGAFLLVSNHVSGLDPVVVELTCPRPIGFIAKKESMANPFIRFLAHIYSAIPVDRSRLDLNTARVAIGLLHSGTPIFVTPEGTRSPDPALRPFKSGYLKLAASARVPIVPVGIRGTFQVLPRHHRFPRPGRIVVHYGQPYTGFLESPEELHGAALEDHNACVRDMVRALLVEGAAPQHW